ncbi:GNAT family N-acetyltransferase [Alkalicaulis satelles]|uniref:GNAT family N-acetyltransferase n=1 Tax=Alkalicaulis satelles TaxID=2609175 RepID=A0A5M6ZFH5_9PROT|nr:GNAT family N-acetyltransferase [Alkalicaulis satelles]KAA5803496.1 GNAT family N-acetyltransferase [Alkalicaulis satelles]
MSVLVRQAEPGDERALALAGAATFLDSYAGVVDGAAIVRHCFERHTPQVYAAALADPAQALWIAEAAPGGAPVGYLHLAPPGLPVETRPGDIEMKRIYVLSRLQRTGLGLRLLEHGLAHARAAGRSRMLLGVYQGNERAIAFYKAQGFHQAGEREFDVGGRVYCDWVMARDI